MTANVIGSHYWGCSKALARLGFVMFYDLLVNIVWNLCQFSFIVSNYKYFHFFFPVWYSSDLYIHMNTVFMLLKVVCV